MSYQAVKRHEVNLNAYLLSERSQSEKVYRYRNYRYDSNHMTFWKRQNYGDSKKISSCQGLGRGMDE
jgi:hypothetical protein